MNRMNTRNIVTWLSPLAVALLAFGSQIALAQEASTTTREQVRAEVLQAKKSGALERRDITSYSPNSNWGPGAPAHAPHSSQRAGAQPQVSPEAGSTIQTTQNPGSRVRDPV